MDKVLDESARKIKGIVERQSKRLGAKYANPHIQSNKAAVGLAKHAHSKSTISATGAEEATDLSQLLESGLSLETAQPKQSVGASFPRQNRSPRQAAFGQRSPNPYTKK